MGSTLPGNPLVWSPKGCSDTLDSSTAFNGAMSALTDLIPDPTTADLFQCRPAAIALSTFPGFANPAFVSCMKVVGTRVYGMIASTRNAGNDEPFIYDIPSNSFIAITGITAANTPISPASSGTWNPPTMDIIGARVIVTHPGFTGVGGAFFGVLNIANPAAPTWTATNTSPNALVSPPQWVANFNGRAFFLVNPSTGQPAAYMSDQLAATTITNANQILTFGDNVPLTVEAGLPLANQLGGVIQALMVFKGVTNIYQVTGDFALGNLAINTLNVATGTLGPLTVTSTSKGLVFIAPDGLRVIDFNARVSDPIGKAGTGVTQPFFFALTPSRMNAAFNGGVYRVQVQNGGAPGNPQQQWWYDFVRGVWTGPHTQQFDMIDAYSNTFLVTLRGVNAKLFQSDQVQSSTSTYVENGTQLNVAFTTPMLPDTDQMSEVAMVETTLHMALAVGSPVTLNWLDQNNTIIDTVTITPTGSSTIWGAFTWGAALWQGAQNALYPRQLKWHFPIVFRRGGLMASVNSASGIKIGRLHMRYQVLGYLQQ